MPIPPSLDDGFTFEVGPDTFCRPMSNRVRLELQGRPDADLMSVLYEPPYTFSPYPDPYRDFIAMVVLDYSVAKENQEFQDLSDTLALHTTGTAGYNLSMLKCSDCKQFAVNHDTGEIQTTFGKPKPLPGGAIVPCETDKGCPKGTHHNPIGLSNPRWAKTWQCYWRYRDQTPLINCPLYQRNLLLLNWTVDYGRNPALNPFIGRGSS